MCYIHIKMNAQPVPRNRDVFKKAKITEKTDEQRRSKNTKTRTYGTDPVKLIPARSREPVMESPKQGPSAGTKLTTPGGTPASVMI